MVQPPADPVMEACRGGSDDREQVCASAMSISIIGIAKPNIVGRITEAPVKRASHDLTDGA